MRSKTVCNFSENSSDLVAPPFPQSNVVVGIEEDLRLKCSFTGRIGDMRTARQWGTDNMLCQYANGNSKAKSFFTSQNWREATRSGCERLWTPRALVGATLIMTALELSDFSPLKATRTLSLTSQSRRTGLDSCPRWKSSLMMRNPQGDKWPSPIYWLNFRMVLLHLRCSCILETSIHSLLRKMIANKKWKEKYWLIMSA